MFRNIVGERKMFLLSVLFTRRRDSPSCFQFSFDLGKGNYFMILPQVPNEEKYILPGGFAYQLMTLISSDISDF